MQLKVLQSIYLSPMTREDWRNVADGFYEKWNFPNYIGAVDGKYNRIQALKNLSFLFFNYKKFFSILMASCDVNYVFKWVDIGNYGAYWFCLNSEILIINRTKFINEISFL